MRAALPAGDRVAVAVSGGPDSLVLLLAAVAVAPALRSTVAAFTVDHGWHAGSAVLADQVTGTARDLGCDPVAVLPARAVGAGGAKTGGGGPEGEARRQRYEALDAASARHDVAAVLLGHTLDDQAETVLLGLARGSGARSLAGMPPVRGSYRRPLLGLRRDVVHAALPVLLDGAGLGGRVGALPWHDPANTDPVHARTRVRHEALPALERALGPGVVEGLARSADLLRSDADALDTWATAVVADLPVTGPGSDCVEVPLASLAPLPDAVLSRVVRQVAAGVGAGALTGVHTAALVALVRVRPGSGAGPVALPGARGRRRGGRLVLERAGPIDGLEPDQGVAGGV